MSRIDGSLTNLSNDLFLLELLTLSSRRYTVGQMADASENQF